MKFFNIKKLAVVLIAAFTFSAFAQSQTQERDVPYTKELLTFINAYFNHDIDSREKGVSLYNTAKETCPESYTEYQKETHIARCEYYFGLYVIETFDLTQLEHALDDTSVEYVDPVERNKQIKAEAQKYFDAAIAHSDKAVKMKGAESPDAMVIFAQAVSANCTVRTTSYVLNNGLKIGANAKKALKADPKNGTASFSAYAQDVYAPSVFGNPVRGRKMMLSFLNDSTLTCEKFDKFNYTCAVAYTYYRQKNYTEAKVWYNKCLEIYPKNYAVTDLIKKCDAEINK